MYLAQDGLYIIINFRESQKPKNIFKTETQCTLLGFCKIRGSASFVNTIGLIDVITKIVFIKSYSY